MMNNFALTPENVGDVRHSLVIVARLEHNTALVNLSFLRSLYSPELLRAAYLLLNDDQKIKIKNLTIELNAQNTPVP